MAFTSHVFVTMINLWIMLIIQRSTQCSNNSLNTDTDRCIALTNDVDLYEYKKFWLAAFNNET